VVLRAAVILEKARDITKAYVADNIKGEGLTTMGEFDGAVFGWSRNVLALEEVDELGDALVDDGFESIDLVVWELLDKIETVGRLHPNGNVKSRDEE